MPITIQTMRAAGLTEAQIMMVLEKKTVEPTVLSPQQLAEIKRLLETIPRWGGKRLDGECWVYLLFDPLKKRPFYVGISRDPYLRWDQHVSDPASSAWPIVRKLLQVGITRQQILKLYKRCVDRNAAAAIEFRLIHSIPTVVNADKGKLWGAPTWRLQ